MSKGGNKPVVTGYKYYAGFQAVLCRGPIDGLIKITFDQEKVAWTNPTPVIDQLIAINEPNLFGGEEREGGVVGNMALWSGKPDQAVDPYLLEHFFEAGTTTPATNIPAFRDVASIVWYGGELSANNYYMKPFKPTASRIYTKEYGERQWYPKRAGIGEIVKERIAVYFALDASGSMSEMTDNGHTRFENLITAAYGTFDYLLELVENEDLIAVDICVCFWGTDETVRSTATYREIDAAKITALKTWADTHGPGYKTYFPAGLLDAEDFFTNTDAGYRHIILTLTDGFPSANNTGYTELDIAEAANTILTGLTNVSYYAFNIDLADTTYSEYLDMNQSPVLLDGADPTDIKSKIIPFILWYLDMNPAHIIRECRTSRLFGSALDESKLNDTSFKAAADTLYDENFGLSFLWNRESDVNEFIDTVLEHIDGTLYEDFSTGKLCLYLIRNDYDVETLLTLDKSNIKEVSGFKRNLLGDLVSSVSVKYWNRQTGVNSVEKARNVVLEGIQDDINHKDISCEGIVNKGLANKVAHRYLRHLSSPTYICEISCNRDAEILHKGSPFLFYHDSYVSAPVVMRVSEIDYGSDTNQEIKISCIQDIFTFETQLGVFSNQQITEYVDPINKPAVSILEKVQEIPYYILATTKGDNYAASFDEDSSIIVGAIVKPTKDSMYASLWSDKGSGYIEYAKVSFSGYGIIDGALNAELETTLTLSFQSELETIAVGDFLEIIDGDNSEFVKISGITDDIDFLIFQVKRGVLDTVPLAHGSNCYVLYWQYNASSDNQEYLTGETIDFKFTSVTPKGKLDLADANEINLTIAGRLHRPISAANVLINAASYPATVNGDLNIEWSHRNRLTQTAYIVEQGDASLPPEDDTYYTIEGKDSLDVVFYTFSGIIGNTHIIPNSVLPTVGTEITITVGTIRGVTPSWQNQIIVTTVASGGSTISGADDLDTFTVSVDSEQNRIYTWDITPDPLNLDFVEIRYCLESDLQDWEDMTVLTTADFAPLSLTLTEPIDEGVYIFAIKAINNSAQYSINPLYCRKELSSFNAKTIDIFSIKDYVETDLTKLVCSFTLIPGTYKSISAIFGTQDGTGTATLYVKKPDGTTITSMTQSAVPNLKTSNSFTITTITQADVYLTCTTSSYAIIQGLQVNYQ